MHVSRLLAPVLLVSTATLIGQAGPPGRLFRSAIDVTTVGVTVRDRDGHLVKDLQREAFDLFEDGRLQTVTQFTNERVPMSVGILLDTSDSMFGRRIDEARDAIGRFVIELLDKDDEFAILGFNHRQQLLTAWTSDRDSDYRVQARNGYVARESEGR